MSRLTGPIKILVTETNPGEAEKLASLLKDDSDFAIVGYAQDGLEAAQLSYRLRPDMALLWEDLPGLRGVEACELISRTAPEVASVLITRSQDADAARLAQAAGARAVVPEKQIESLPAVLRDVAQTRAEMPTDMIDRITDARRAPAVVTVTGAKGGVGKTTVAVNLAVWLARNAGEVVALIEAPGQLGDAAVLLDSAPRHSFLSLLESGSFDADVVRNSLVRHDSGMSLLPATAENPVEELALLPQVDVATVGTVLGTVKRDYTMVVVDAPISLWQQTAYLATRSHVVVVVATVEDVAAIRDTTTLLELLLVAGVPRERIVLAVNKVARGPLGPDDLAKAADWNGYLSIPSDPTNVVAAVNEGVPLVLRSPSSPAARAVVQLAQKVLQMSREGAAQ